MSTQKKQNQIINRTIFERLKRLPYLYQMDLSVFIAFIGLQLVNNGDVVPVSKAVRIIKKAKLHKKLEKTSIIPLNNILESLIHLVIIKRELIKKIIEHPEYEVWNNEATAPIFDILEQIYNKYRI